MPRRRTRIPRWLGALLAPAEDPRGQVQQAPPSAGDLLADLRRSRAELAALREQLEATLARTSPSPLDSEGSSSPSPLDKTPLPEGEGGTLREGSGRLREQLRELAEQELELLHAEQRLGVSIEARRAEEVLERARRAALEAELHAD